MADLTPREIVSELDKYIIGQDKAKRAVAIALRNRYRRNQLTGELKEEVIPKNILMIGATGVGKTEIARRLAHLAGAPMIKVEATKFTEVGYVGRDVDSMVRDLVETGVQMVENEWFERVKGRADELATERVLDLLVGAHPRRSRRPRRAVMRTPFPLPAPAMSEEDEEERPSEVEQAEREREERLREKLRGQLLAGALADREVEIEVEETRIAFARIFGTQGMEEMGFDLPELLGQALPKQKKTRRVTVGEARRLLTSEEAEKLIDREAVTREAIQRVEQTGIIFVDELDKVAGRESGHGPDVSREGVQRDILPIVEGSTVMTKYGHVNTHHILFIAAGAFHVTKPSDLIPELQGRFPIRVELENLTRKDFERILTEPRNALVKQYEALLAVEGVELNFTPDGVSEIARLCEQVNQETENIGARRLHTVVERLLEDVSFEASGEEPREVVIDEEYVRAKLQDIVKDEDLSRYIL